MKYNPIRICSCKTCRSGNLRRYYFKKANHPNYCEICVRVGGSCGGMGCGGQFWQQDWDKVKVDGQFVIDSQNNLKLPITD